ncbi:MAG: efflux RND transporter periplasmic adaptor subunit [Gemmatimonadetes bacterium]|nr:efflux RND transporter periplasmic adaptor subunit [Gemmatimonadota bacterium]
MRILLAALAVVILGCTEKTEEQVFQLLPVSTRDILVSASAAGSVEPVLTVEVKSKASGEILDVLVETGDLVTRGDLLVRVDQRIPRNALMQAEADLEVAQAQLSNADAQWRRAEALYETQSITEREFDDALLGQANANASLVRAERSLQDATIAFEDTEVRAPATGVILQRNVEVGTVIQSATSNVGGGAVLLLMANLDTVRVRTLVDETDIGKIQPGLQVNIRVDAYPNQPFQGRVLKIEPQAVTEQNVTMFPVLIRIPNEDGLLRPGMNAEVEIRIGFRRGVLTVPNAALRTRSDVASAAAVLGIDMDTVQAQLAAGRERLRAGREHTDRGEDGDGVRRSGSFPTAGGAVRRSAQALGQSGFQFGGDFIVFVLRDGVPTAVSIRTGLTDLDYSEVVAGLAASDSVFMLSGLGSVQGLRGGGQRGQGGPQGGR